MNLNELKAQNVAPEWLTQEGLSTLENNYLLFDEMPVDMYKRVAKAAASYYIDSNYWEKKFFDYIWKGWLACASPILSNLGTNRGLPISCNSIHVGDSIHNIYMSVHELAVLSKHGAGVGVYLGDIRGRGTPIKGNGKSEGVVGWAKSFDTTTCAVSQGCYDDQTELLTEKGWIKFEDLPQYNKIKVAQVTENKEIEYVDYTDYIKYEVNEYLYHFTDDFNQLDLLVTHDHNLVIENNGEYQLIQADQIDLENLRCSFHGFLYFSHPEIMDFCPNTVNLEKTLYKGYVYCVSVPSKMIKVRRNGKEIICGNSTRRGATALYLPIDHSDIEEFLQIRSPTGDINRRCLNINHGVTINNRWLQEMLAGDQHKRLIWQEILKRRVESGEPYLFFSDNVNNQNPECYKANGLSVETSNICTEIFLHTSSGENNTDAHSFVCCLSSLNLTKYDEWKDTDLVETAVRFLDAVLSEYIEKSANIPGLENSRRSAIKGRAIGIGVLGWHSLLQEKGIPFDSFEAMQLNNEIWKLMRERADLETAKMAQEFGEPEWCKGFNRRHTHTLACAPTVSNSTIAGGHSPSIEPWAANIFVQKSAKGTFIRKNRTLEKILEAKGKNTSEIWRSINEYQGSVQHLSFLSKEEKEVFLTAREINQHAIIKQAAQRQKYIDQGQSINLFFTVNADPKYIHEVHLAAWEMGLKSLYYLRSEGVLRGDQAFRSKDECSACEG